VSSARSPHLRAWSAVMCQRWPQRGGFPMIETCPVLVRGNTVVAHVQGTVAVGWGPG